MGSKPTASSRELDLGRLSQVQALDRQIVERSRAVVDGKEPTVTCCRNPIHCILPSYILDKLAESAMPKVRKLAIEAIARSGVPRI